MLRFEKERKDQNELNERESRREKEELARREAQKAKEILEKEQEAQKLSTESEWMKKAREAKGQIAGAMQSLLEMKAKAEKRKAELESLYAAKIASFDELQGLERAEVGENLSSTKRQVNTRNRFIESINAAIKLHEILESGSNEKLSDQEIIKGLSTVAKHIKEPTTLKDWEKEQDKHYSAALSQARLAKEELLEAYPLIEGNYKSTVARLKTVEEKLKVDPEDFSYWAERKQSLTRQRDQYMDYLGNIHTLNKMIEGTSTADEVLTESHIERLMGTAGACLATKNKPSTLYNWCAEVIKLTEEKKEIERRELVAQKKQEEEQYAKRQQKEEEQTKQKHRQQQARVSRR